MSGDIIVPAHVACVGAILFLVATTSENTQVVIQPEAAKSTAGDNKYVRRLPFRGQSGP